MNRQPDVNVYVAIYKHILKLIFKSLAIILQNGEGMVSHK